MNLTHVKSITRTNSRTNHRSTVDGSQMRNLTNRAFCVTSLVLCVAGCSTWTHPVTGTVNYNRDAYECEREAAAMYPAAMAVSGGGSIGSATTRCNTFGGITRCDTTPAPTVPVSTSDSNSLNRTLAQMSCLKARGYERK